MADAPGPDSDWHLRDWMTLHGKRQSSLVAELGWSKAKANDVWHSDQPYKRDILNEVARWLQLRPYELLMPPHEAMALRRLRETAEQIVADSGPRPFVGAPIANEGVPESLPRKRTGTSG